MSLFSSDNQCLLKEIIHSVLFTRLGGAGAGGGASGFRRWQNKLKIITIWMFFLKVLNVSGTQTTHCFGRVGLVYG